jgi:peroxiredoxin
MKKVKCFFLIFLIPCFTIAQQVDYGKPVINAKETLKYLQSFLIYQRDFVRLSGNFTPLDSALNVITEEKFFSIFATGNYLPLLRVSKQNISSYELCRLDSSTNNEISTTIKEWAKHEYKLYKMRGQELPGFNFTDLKGNVYNKETTKGKILVLKCWFIQCHACVEEMPALNKMVKEYKNRNDILFVSLAMDSKEKLQEFLSQKQFKYAVVPDKESYLLDSLKIEMYPTHLVISRQGLISKVVDNEAHLAAALKDELNKE